MMVPRHTPLRVLILEDVDNDALLVVRQLEQHGFEVDWTRVETEESFRSALEAEGWDVLIADYNLPTFDAPRALEVFRASNLEIPFLVVSGTVGEEEAVQTIKLGADDYIMKDNLVRLGPAVQRELEEAALRRDRARMEREVGKANERLEESHQSLERALGQLHDAQEKLVQQERLRALGKMASGVAHDLNNALTPILGLSELLLRDTGLGENSRDIVETILTSASDASAIINRLRDFSRSPNESSPMAPVDMRMVVEQVVQLTQPRWRDEAQREGRLIDIDIELGDVPAVTGDEHELRQSLINLVINAVDAMPQGGTLTVRLWRANDCVLFEVSDTGVGMSEAVRARCFEPFFSVKGDAGTGLGLSTCHGTVARHGGRIDVETAFGEGTTFRVCLPSSGNQQACGDENLFGTSLPRRSVLYIDDDDRVRGSVVKMLEILGQRVESASSGAEGLAKFRLEPFDVVVTDMGMPEMDGAEVIREVKRSHPGTYVILFTGWGRPPFADKDDIRPDIILAKPASLQDFEDAMSGI